MLLSLRSKVLFAQPCTCVKCCSHYIHAPCGCIPFYRHKFGLHCAGVASVSTRTRPNAFHLVLVSLPTNFARRQHTPRHDTEPYYKVFSSQNSFLLYRLSWLCCDPSSRMYLLHYLLYNTVLRTNEKDVTKALLYFHLSRI